jgi:uncharacterized surface protein with fasciclin (FAS1) repeats
VPLEGTITEVEGRVEAKSGAIPASAIVVEAPQDAGGAAPSVMPAGQELTAAATVVDANIEADNGVIHGIDWVLLPPEALRSF